MQPKRQARKPQQDKKRTSTEQREKRADKSGVAPLPKHDEDTRGDRSRPTERDPEGELTRSKNPRAGEELDDEDTAEDDNVVPRRGTHNVEIQDEDDLGSEER